MPGRGPILVVDDDEGILGFVQMALEDEGYEVLTARQAAAALDAIRQRRPQLILLDLWMPVMNGWDFARAYRELPGPHAPIVVLTAGRAEGPDDGEVEAAAYLSKPFDVDDLVEAVARYVR